MKMMDWTDEMKWEVIMRELTWGRQGIMMGRMHDRGHEPEGWWKWNPEGGRLGETPEPEKMRNGHPLSQAEVGRWST